MGKVFGAAVAFFAMLGTSAHADWVYGEGEESAFNDDQVHVAIGTGVGGIFSFRCFATSGYDAFFITTERAPDDLTNLNAVRPKLKLRVDTGEIHVLSARIMDVNGKVAALGEIGPEILEETRNAKRRLSAAISFGGMDFNEAHFSAKGSTRAINSLFKNCSPPPQDASDSSRTGLADER